MNTNRRKFLKMSAVTSASTIALSGCIEPGETIDELPRPKMGDEDAPLEIHVFDDYSCPVCQDFVLNHLPQIIDEYIEEGLVEYHHYDWPIPVHPRWSSEMANAARAVQDTEGNDTFFEFKTLLYEQQDNISVDVMRNIAEELDVTDVDTVLERGSNSVYQPVIDDDKQYGNELGVGGTPTVFIGGDNFEELEQLPDYTYDTLSQTFDAQL